jgi:hypothetical protein
VDDGGVVEWEAVGKGVVMRRGSPSLGTGGVIFVTKSAREREHETFRGRS